jgi:hypothetical protein
LFKCVRYFVVIFVNDQVKSRLAHWPTLVNNSLLFSELPANSGILFTLGHISFFLHTGYFILYWSLNNSKLHIFQLWIAWLNNNSNNIWSKISDNKHRSKNRNECLSLYWKMCVLSHKSLKLYNILCFCNDIKLFIYILLKFVLRLLDLEEDWVMYLSHVVTNLTLEMAAKACKGQGIWIEWPQN